MKHLFRWPQFFLFGLLTAALPLALVAQEDEDIYELSPFTIDEEEDVGYLATTTLAGTRLQTPLRDIGAAVSILTEELFEDTGAVDAQSILTYAPSSEVGGPLGNFAGLGTGNRANFTNQRIFPQGNQRIRGLASASLTRNYFLTDIPFDTYNSTRVTINRGPNSLLFGIGSPGGVINNSIQGAILGNDFGEVSVRFGERSSHRETIDYNKELIEGRLAVRVSALYDDTQYQQRPAFEIDKRITVGLEAVLLQNEGSDFLGPMTLRANYESGSINGTPPIVIPPSDAMSHWFNPPDPSIQNVTGTTFPGWVTDGSYVRKLTIDDREASFTRINAPGSVIEPGYVQNFIVFNQPNAQSTGIGLADSSIDGMMFNMKFFLAKEGPNVGRPQFNMFRTASFFATNFTPGFTVPSIMDRNVFDNENNLLPGTTNKVSHEFDAANIVLEQLFLEGDAGIELAYDQQHYDRWAQLPFSRGSNGGGTGNYDVALDISEYFGSGEPNPNLGRPYVLDGTYGSWDTKRTDREATRATGFYQIDFAEKSDNLGWLGRHVFTGLYNKQTIDDLSKAYWPSWRSDRTDLRTNHENAGINTFFTKTVAIAYIGDSQLGAQSFSDIRLADHLSIPVSKDSDTHKITFYDRASGLVQTSDSFNIRTTLRGGNIDRQEVESEVLSWQSYFFDGNLVGLAGWRSDTSTVFERVGNSRLPSGIYDENNLVLKDDPSSEISGNTFTWSLVGHVPYELPGGTDLSVHYGESENFEPVGVQRNSFGEVLPPPSGITTEYGFTLGLLENKLSMRFNWFETESKGANANMPRIPLVSAHGAYLFSRYIRAVNSGMTLDEVLEFSGGPEAVGTYSSLQELFDDLNALNHPKANEVRNPRIEDGSVVRVDAIPGETATTDFVAEGFEFEMVGNLTPSWRVFFNIAKQETIQSNVAPEYRELLEHIKGTLAASKFATWKGSPAPAEDFTFTDFLGFRAIGPSAAVLAKEGNLNQELRKWRANLVTTYDFREGSLKGFSAGGGIRWQDGVATGYPNIINNEGQAVPDLSRPFFGPSELNGDLWIGYSRQLTDKIEWKIQLNLRNAFGDSDPITVVTNPDGRVAVIRNPLPKDIFLTNTFRF